MFRLLGFHKSCLLFILAAFGLLGTAAEKTLTLEGVYSGTTPKLDGVLDDAVWQKAPVISDFRRGDGKELLRKTEARILWTPTAMVVGFKAFVPREKLIAESVSRDGRVYVSDCVEVMLDPSGGSESYKHFVVNAANSVYDRACEQGGYVGDKKWNGKVQSAVRIEPDFWSCEIRIPYSSLDMTGVPSSNWSINLARESYGDAAEPRELSSVCGGSFNIAGAFRKIATPAEIDFSAYAVAAAAPKIDGRSASGKFEITVNSALHELGGRHRDFQVECAIFDEKGRVVVRRRLSCTVAPNGKTPLEFDSIKIERPGHYTGMLTARDAQSNRVVMQRAFEGMVSFVPIKITFRDPHYRDLIFASQKLDRVRFNVEFDLPAEQLKGAVVGGIRVAGGATLVEKTLPAARGAEFEFENGPLPEARLEAFVELRAPDGKVVATSVRKFQKLPFKAGEVWRDKNGDWHRDGRKIFINAAWICGNDWLDEYNVILGDLAPGDTQKLFFNQHLFLNSGSIRGDLKQGAVTRNVLNFYRERIDKYKDHPQLFAHFLCDEPDVMGYTTESFERIAAFIAEVDPWHPILILPGSNGLVDFGASGEISGFHCYPKVERDIRMNNLEKIVYIMDQAREHFATHGGAPTVLYTHQGFDYSDNGNLNTRIPDYAELRNQNLLSLILGGKGILHYNRQIEQYPELYIGGPNLAREQRVIGESAIIHPDASEKPRSEHKSLRMLAKQNENDGSFWVMVCNTAHESGDYSFDFAPFGDNEVTVLSEGRRIKVQKGRIVDYFTPFQVHVYTTNGKNFNLRNIADIEREIEAVYTRRAADNIGNLAYQRHEAQAVKVTASSNKYPIYRADNSLWHVADGVTGGPAADRVHGRGIVYWQDATPNQAPDWLVMEFPAPTVMGRVVVWPVDGTLKDYEIQLRSNGGWQTVGKVENAAGDSQSITFAPRPADAIRLNVTATRGAFCKVFEIQVYAK